MTEDGFDKSIWESSHQKRERLVKELRDTLSKIKSLIFDFERDSHTLRTLKGKMDAVTVKLDELQSLEDAVAQKSKELDLLGSTVTEDDDALFNKVIDGSVEAYSEIMKIRGKISALFDEFDQLSKESDVIEGNSDGLMAVVNINLEKVKSLREEIEKIDRGY